MRKGWDRSSSLGTLTAFPPASQQAPKPQSQRPDSGAQILEEGLDMLQPRSLRLQTRRNLAGIRAQWSFKAWIFQPKLQGSPMPGCPPHAVGADPREIYARSPRCPLPQGLEQPCSQCPEASVKSSPEYSEN